MLLLVTMIGSCKNLNNDNIAPPIFININTTRVETKEGVMYVSGIAFSGIAYGLYTDGDTALIYPYSNGRLQGKTKEWYSNKQLKETRYYDEGRKTGVHKGWYANGQIRFIYNMQADHFEGNVKEWYEDGKLYRDFNYVNGQEDGMQRMYYANGKIKANYQSVNGRKYGLTGVKNCVSVWSGDSVIRH